MAQNRNRAISRLAVCCLGTTALTLPALAGTFNVGGGTIITTQVDASTDNTGTGGPFALKANTTTTGDAITISGVSITNTSHTPNGRALDVGGSLPSSGPYSVVMNGSTLRGDTGFATGGAGAWFQSAGGLVSFDSTGGAVNTISGKQGLAVINNASNGSVSIRTGADTITSSDGEAIYGVAQGTGTISINSIGATVTGNGIYGIVAVGGNGAIAIGGLNNGIASTINVAGGTGIYTSSISSQNITLASTGVINALTGISVQGTAAAIDSFGTINATTAITSLSGTNTPLTVTLESGSATSGAVVGENGNDSFTIFGAATVTGATFNGGGGNNSLTLTGVGNGSLAVSTVSNVQTFQKSGTGTWTLTRTTSNVTPWTVSGGTLSIADDASLGNSSGLLTLNGGTLQVTATTIASRSISLGASGGAFNVSSGATLTEGGVISGSGSFTKAGAGTLTASFGSSFTGAIVINGGTLSVLNNASFGGASPIALDGGALQFGASTTVSGRIFVVNSGGGAIDTDGNTVSASLGANPGAGMLTKLGAGTLILTSNYSGPATVSAGTLQIGDGGTLGDITGNVINNGIVVFNKAGTITPGITSGTGSVSQIGSGTTFLAGSNTYTGGTTIAAGTLRIDSDGSLPSAGTLTISGGTFDLHGHAQTVGALSGSGGTITLGSGALTANSASNTNLASAISGTGSFIKNGTGTLTLTGANTYTGGTTVTAGTLQLGTGGSLASTGALTVNGGIFDLNGHTQSVGALSSAGGAITLGSGALTTNSSSNSTLAAVVSGTGSLIKSGTGALILTAANTYTGGTTISGGTLQIGGGGTAGAIAGNIVNNGALSFNRSDAATFAGVVSGTGTVTQAGSGTLTLSGTNTYTGATSVTAGTLNVTGRVAGSGISVASGATLTGTGTVSTTAVAGGGTLTPGNGTVPGTLTVSGNLSLASGATYVDAVTPTATNLSSVSSAASVNGNFVANFASGTYTVGQRYTVLTAGGGVSGTFAAASSSGAPTYVKPRLSYDANNVYLNLDPNTLASLQTGASANQSSGTAAIDKAVAAGTIPPAGFVVLYGLSGAALNSAVDQISGQIGSNVANSAGQSFLSFMSMSVPGGSGGSFAPGHVYGGTDAPRRAKLGTGETRVWGAVYGGHVGLASDAASGAAGLSANNVGMIGGADLQLGQGLLVGVSGGFGRQDFRSGNGTGTSDDTMIGLYARQDAGRLYVTAAFGLGWHQITTQRTISVSGTDVLQGKQDAKDYGGRVEAGWRIASRSPIALSPYVAVAGDSFETPAYAETVVSGASTFALSYAAHTSTLGRAELGARLDRDYQIDGGILSAAMHAAWAHRLGDAPFTQASFQALPGASFVVRGVRTDSDTALLGVDLDVKQNSGLFFGVNAETQAGMRTTILQGMGHLGWRW